MPYAADGTFICVLCGTRNDPRQRVCAKCGSRIVTPADYEPAPPRKPTGTTATATDDAGDADDADEVGDADGSGDFDGPGERTDGSSFRALRMPDIAPYWWVVLLPTLGFGSVSIVAGVMLFVREPFQGTSLAALGFGAFFIWAFRRMVNAAIAEQRAQAVGEVEDESLDEEFFDEDGNELWRIPGYGTDAEDRAEESPTADPPLGP